MSRETDPVPSDEALAGVRERFVERHAQAAAPSTVYGVVAGGRLVDCGGFGDYDGHGATPGPDTAYRLASCTKSFTAAALLILRDRGVLALDTPITDFVPAFAGVHLPTSDSPVPTLRMLATMSAGLPNDDPWADRQEALSDDQFDAVLRAGVRFAFVPGTEYEYSNLGYALLGRAIQVAAGRRYHDVVTDELLVPLGLSATGFTASTPEPGGVAIGHERVDGEWRPLPFSGPGAFSPIGGLFSTVNDMARWMQFFLDAFRGSSDGPLSATSRREMQQGQRMIPPPPSGSARPLPGGYGLGLVAEHDPDHGTIVSHSGGYPGFSAHMRWHPATGVGIVALENGTYAAVSRPTSEAMLRLLDTLGAPPSWRPWPETLAAQAAVTRLVVAGWDDAVAAGLFSDNVALDAPFERRRAMIDEAVARAGALGAVVGKRSAYPNDREWRIRGELADLRCELTMNPQDPPLVQTLEVRVEQHTGAGEAPRA